jgi:stalled ribosome rescue protein Dom34
LKVLGLDRQKGEVRLRVENTIDLLNLEKIAERGDLATARTTRTMFIRRGEEKLKSDRKTMVLSVKVEKVELSSTKDKLRLVGKISEGPDGVQRGSYHTIEIGVGNALTLQKELWSEEKLERLEKAKVRIEFVKDEKEMEELNVHLAKGDGLATYGMEEVKAAASMGAVKELFVCEEKATEKEVEELIEDVSGKRGEVRLVSEESKYGEKFCKAYGIAANLRFVVS